jgi:hypothetical protein
MMKKALLIIVAVVLLTGVLSSCSERLCPAYSYADDIEQVENV